MKLFLLITLLLSLPIGTAMAQQVAGDREIAVSLFYFQTVGSDADFKTGSIQGKFGRFMSDEVSLGVSPTISFSSDGTVVGTGLFGTYSFLAADTKSVPYVGAQYYIPNLDKLGESSALGLTGGVKYYFAEKAFADGSINFLKMFGDLAEGASILTMAGLGFLF